MPDRREERVDWAGEIIKWARTRDGEEEISESNERALKAIKDFRRNLVVEKEMLHTAFNC